MAVAGIFIIGFSSEERPIVSLETTYMSDGYILYKRPDPEFEAAVVNGALAAWNSEIPIAWHPYQHLQICDINGNIIPGNTGLPLNAYLNLQTTLPNSDGSVRVQNNSDYIHSLQQYIEAILNNNPTMLRLVNFGQPYRVAGFQLQGAQWVQGGGNPPQPYMFYNNVSVSPAYASKDDFKIHLCPRPEYLFWTFFQTIKFAMTTQLGKNGIYKMKVCLPGRPQNLRPDDEFLINLDGGSSPGIIIYITTAKIESPQSLTEYFDSYMKYLKLLHLLFIPFESVIGNITEKVKLPFGNVRHNQLIAYASGTRFYKLGILDGSITDPTIIAAYNTPPWVTELCAKAINNNNAGSRKILQKAFYEDICRSAQKQVLQLAKSPLPDPRTIDAYAPEITDATVSAIRAKMNSYRIAGGRRRRRTKNRVHRRRRRTSK
jgi:hypothetical protein